MAISQSLHRTQMLELDLAQAQAKIRKLEEENAALKSALANHDQLASMSRTVKA